MKYSISILLLLLHIQISIKSEVLDFKRGSLKLKIFVMKLKNVIETYYTEKCERKLIKVRPVLEIDTRSSRLELSSVFS